MPTAEQVLYAKVKHAMSVSQRRKLRVKWERWKAADAEIRKRQRALKRLPNDERKPAFEEVRKQLLKGGFKGKTSADLIRKNYYEIRGLIKKVTGSSAD